MSHRLTGRLAGSLAAVLLVAAGCGTADDPDEPTTLTVFAAASLTTAFEQVAEEFEDTHPGVEVELALAGSSDLAAQISQGAPADVFASADEANMARVTAQGLHAAEPRAFAANSLQIAVPPDNPASVSGFADLADDDLALVVCAPQVPCGASTAAVARAAGLTLSPVSEEQSVTDVLAKVVTGEADAGVVYRTDVEDAGDAVHGIEVDMHGVGPNLYPIVPVDGSDEPELAADFVELVLGEVGRSILASAGFAAVP